MSETQAVKPPPEPPRRADRGVGLWGVYVLAAGMLLGVLAGPAGLGQLWPGGYAGLFGGSVARGQWLEGVQATRAAATAWQSVPGVSGTAVSEDLDRRAAVNRQQHAALGAVMDRRAAEMILAVGVALGAVMLIEALTAGGSRARHDAGRRLGTG